MTMQGVRPATEFGADREIDETLRSAALGPHEHIGTMLDDAASHRGCGDDPRRARQLADTFMATTCRHLAAVDDQLLPAARRHLDGGRQIVTGYILHSRELERTVHAMKALMYGDARATKLTCSELWMRVRGLLAEHEAQECAIVERLHDAMSSDDLATLAARLVRTEQRSPTRPHPYSPHACFAGRFSHRVWAVVDEIWDSAEGRTIPQQPPTKHPRCDSLLTRYMLGSPGSTPPSPGSQRQAS